MHLENCFYGRANRDNGKREALCYELMGTVLQRVEIKKGVSLEHSRIKGMCRTLDTTVFEGW